MIFWFWRVRHPEENQNTTVSLGDFGLLDLIRGQSYHEETTTICIMHSCNQKIQGLTNAQRRITEAAWGVNWASAWSVSSCTNDPLTFVFLSIFQLRYDTGVIYKAHCMRGLRTVSNAARARDKNTLGRNTGIPLKGCHGNNTVAIYKFITVSNPYFKLRHFLRGIRLK